MVYGIGAAACQPSSAGEAQVGGAAVASWEACRAHAAVSCRTSLPVRLRIGADSEESGRQVDVAASGGPKQGKRKAAYDTRH